MARDLYIRKPGEVVRITLAPDETAIVFGPGRVLLHVMHQGDEDIVSEQNLALAKAALTVAGVYEPGGAGAGCGQPDCAVCGKSKGAEPGAN